MPLKGVETVSKNLTRELKNIKSRTEAGLQAAGWLITAKSKEKTPVNTGNLKGSHYTATGKVAGRPTVEIGLTAVYAAKVHENLQPVNRKSKVGEPKFLEKAIHENTTKIVEIVRIHAGAQGRLL